MAPQLGVTALLTYVNISLCRGRGEWTGGETGEGSPKAGPSGGEVIQGWTERPPKKEGAPPRPRERVTRTGIADGQNALSVPVCFSW